MKFLDKIMLCFKVVFFLIILFGNHQTLVAKETYQEVISTLETSFNNRQGDYFNQHVDFERLLRLAFHGIDISDKFQRDFTAGFVMSAKQQLASQFLNSMPADKKVKLIKQRFPGNLAEGTMRFDFGESGYGYIRFILKEVNGKVRIVDWFDYARGQLYSKTLSSIIRSVAPRTGIIGRIQDIATNKRDEGKLLLELSNLVKAKEFVKIKEFYHKSKSQIEHSWELMTTILNSANMSGDEPFYFEVLKDIAKQFEGQTRASFMLMDYYFLEENWLKVIPILDGLSEEFDHNDAGIFYLKLNAYVQAKDYEKAKLMGEKAIALERDFEEAYWGLVTVSIERADYQEAITALKRLESIFGFKFQTADFDSDPYYSEFVKSAAYKRWL